MAAAGAEATLDLVTWWSLISSAALLAASVIAVVFENGGRKLVAEKAEKFARGTMDKLHSLASPDADAGASDTRPAPVDAHSLKELRLAAGDLMDGWARAVAGPSLTDRLRNAGLVALALAALTAVAAAVLGTDARTEVEALSAAFGVTIVRQARP